MFIICLYSPQKIPYTDAIPGGLKTGMAVYFQGAALATGITYVFMLLIMTYWTVFSSGNIYLNKSMGSHWLHFILPECYVYCMDFYCSSLIWSFYSTHRFEINLIAGSKERGDVTFHMYYTFSDSLAYNTRRNGNWENVERVPGCPISKGSAFDIFFVIKSEGYEVWRLK